jgi:predicted nucleic acid-binding protein
VVGTTALSYAEIFSGLTRKLREGGIDRPGYKAAAEAFEKDWPLLFRIPLSFDVLTRARALMETYPLRTGDAVQLASAHVMASPGSVTFASADRALIRAAVAEGFSVL